MRYQVDQITAQSEPVTVAEVVERLRLLPPTNDETEYVIKPMITAAREYCESRAGYAFIPQEITAYPDTEDLQAGIFYLPRPPVITVSTVKTYGTDGTETALSNCQSDQDGRFFIADSVDLSALRAVNPIAITYSAGTQACPEAARQAILLLVGHWYQNRESVQTGAVTAVEIAQTTDALLKLFKRWW